MTPEMIAMLFTRVKRKQKYKVFKATHMKNLDELGFGTTVVRCKETNACKYEWGKASWNCWLRDTDASCHRWGTNLYRSLRAYRDRNPIQNASWWTIWDPANFLLQLFFMHIVAGIDTKIWYSWAVNLVKEIEQQRSRWRKLFVGYGWIHFSWVL